MLAERAVFCKEGNMIPDTRMFLAQPEVETFQ
jgi:hypothetical protein